MQVLDKVLATSDLAKIEQLRDARIPEQWRKAKVFLDHTPCENVCACRHANASS